MKTANNTPTKIPTEEDWNDLTDFVRDEVSMWNIEYAKKNLKGKSLEKAQEEMMENFGAYFDDFCDMPRRCFQYYIITVQNIIKNYEWYRDTDHRNFYEISWIASCYITFLETRLERDPKALTNDLESHISTLDFIAENQTEMGIDEDIFGNMTEIIEDLKNLCRSKGLDV